MRIVTHYINEKFSEESDPVRDMGIGVEMHIKKWFNDIVKTGSNTSKPSYTYIKSALTFCAAYGKTEWVKYFLDKYPREYIMKKTDASENALPWAAENGYYDIVKILLKYGMDPSVLDDFAVMYAKNNGHMKIFNLLIKDPRVIAVAREKNLEYLLKESVNEKFVENSDPIADMKIGAIEEIKKWLVAHKINPTFDDIKYSGDILFRLVDYNKTDYIRYLLSHKLLNIKDKDAIIALGNAAFSKMWGICKLLIKYGVDIDKTIREYSDGNTKITHKNLLELKQKMKKSSVNEKFEEDSDPVKDIGIGMRHAYKNMKNGDLFRFTRRLDIENSDPHRFFPKGGIIEIESASHQENDDLNIQYKYYRNKTNFKRRDIDRNNIWRWRYDFFAKYFEPVTKRELNEAFTEESDSIQDMGIGMSQYFKEIFNRFGAADEEQWIYTIVINDSEIDFWFRTQKLHRATVQQLAMLNTYVQKIISELGYDAVMLNPEMRKCYYEDAKLTLPRIVRYKLKHFVQGKIKNGEYRREYPEHNVTFVDYGKVSSGYEKEASQEIDKD